MYILEFIANGLTETDKSLTLSHILEKPKNLNLSLTLYTMGVVLYYLGFSVLTFHLLKIVVGYKNAP